MIGTRVVSGAMAATAGAVSDVAGRALLGAVQQGLDWPYTTQALDRVIHSPVAEHAVGSVLRSPWLDRAVVAALESEAADRLAAEVLESRMFADLVERLLATDALWELIDGIVSSPAVTAAVTQTSRGLADDVAEEVRGRSRGADAWLERVARRVSVHRHDDGATTGRLVTGDP